ncbi:glycosyltransferase [Microcella sp.]|uniref:glycosyltransferase n=1 Tax=Microcella sp. TaxID=1913979 RepID=UPI00255D24BC|nr:glycosyltransferase [Microcella sp.]MBX9472742.1 glycosyltransferase [Microcella sp.]
MSLTWISGRRRARCIPCDAERNVETLFTAETSVKTPMLGTLCDSCASITVHGGELQSEPNDRFVDHYLQSEAGIDTILQNLYRVDRGPGTSFLDVGANYGFATRYARDVLGWNALGVEPSYSGRRGARELGVDILEQYVTAETTLGRTFDVILASEVVEHVPDPREFLHAMRVHLAPGGVLLLTTPAAEIVRPATEQAAIQAVGPGGHLFLASQDALRTMLVDSGFGSATVERDGPTLYAAAAVEPGLELSVTSTGPSHAHVAEFLGALAGDPASPGLLRAAMAVRRYRTLVNSGIDAVEAERDMVAIVAEVHGVDLADPRAVAQRIAAGEPLPIVISPAAFACGMRRVVHRIEWPEAVEYFALAEAAVADKRHRFHVFDGDSRIIEAESRAHRTLALLHTDPTAARALWSRLTDAGELIDAARWTVRLYVEASALGHRTLFDDALAPVATAIVELGEGGDESSTIAAIDGSYLLSRAAVSHGDRWCATQWASVAEQVLEARREGLPGAWTTAADDRLLGLRGEIGALQAEAIPSVVPMPGPAHEAMLWASSPVETVPGAISVIMALYRGERYVREALESIAAQTHQPLEVVVVDDGSPDNSVALIEKLTLPFALRIVRQGNAGQSAARNTGIRAARGEFIAFLDQDDVWRANHLEVLAQTIETDPSLAWVFGDFDLIDDQGHTIVSSYLTETAVVLDRRTVADIVRTDIMALPSASLMRRSALEQVRGFDRRLSGYEDDELYLRLYRRGFTVAAQPRTRIRYRTHSANASSSVAFLRSRLVYLQVLTEQYPAASGRAGAAEVAAERLLRSTTSEYFTALVAHDDALARTISWATERIIPLAHGVSSYHQLGLRIMRRPGLMRLGMRLAGALPTRMRRRLLPPLAAQAHDRLHPHRRGPASTIDLGDRPVWMRARS